jgi:Lipocalin-like domain
MTRLLTRRCIVTLAWVCTFASPNAFAEQCTGPQLGTWRLLSFTSKDVETGETTAPYGLYPTGFLSYTPDCRVNEIIVREHRTPPASIVPTETEKSALYDGLISYSGSYTVAGQRLTYHVDASWNETWTGGPQVRQFRIDGNTLYIDAPPRKNQRDGKVSLESFIWVRLR